jgi:hypothetical protein
VVVELDESLAGLRGESPPAALYLVSHLLISYGLQYAFVASSPATKASSF